MPQGAGFDGNRRAGGNPNGHVGGDGGGVGPHGGRSFGGVGSATPGGWGFGGNQISGGGYYGGPRRQQGTIATRPATVGNLMAAGSFLGATGPFRALGMALSGMDPYSGPVGQAHFSGADTPGSMLGTLRPGLMQPQQPQMAPGQMVPGPMQPPPAPPQIPQAQMPGRYLSAAPGYGVNVPAYGYAAPNGTPSAPASLAPAGWPNLAALPQIPIGQRPPHNPNALPGGIHGWGIM